MSAILIFYDRNVMCNQVECGQM